MATCVPDHPLWKLTGGVENARRHRVACLLYVLNPSELPAAIRREFRKDFLKTSAENLLFLHETKNVLELLDRTRIPAIPLKGVLFGSRFYPDIGARPQSDVDVLVKEEDLERAHSALIKSDWQEAFPREFYEGHYHWVYRKKGSSCLLELHWRFKFPGTCAPALDRVWKNARPTRMEGIRFLEMSTEDLLEYMAVNKAMQHFSMLLDFVDIGQILANSSIDWERFLQNVRLDRTSGPVWFGLTFARKLLDASVPERVLEILAQQPEALGARGLKQYLLCWGGPLAVSSGLLLGPSGRIYEAMLEGYPSAVWSLFKPLIFPSKGRLRTLAEGSYVKYWKNQLSHMSDQILAAFSQ